MPASPGMNLLAPAHEAYDDGPVVVAIEVGNEELRLGTVEVSYALAALHEVGGLVLRPGALGFVEDDDVVVWRRGPLEAGVAEVMDVLDERFDLLADDALALGVAMAGEFVTGQGFLKDGDEGFSCRKGRRRGLRRELTARCDVEADERLAGAGNSGHEDDRLRPIRAGSLDDLLHAGRGHAEVARAGVVSGDRIDGVLRVERPRGLDDGRRRSIRGAAPSSAVERKAGGLGEGRVDRGPQAVRAAPEGPAHAVGMRVGPFGIRAPGLGGEEDREDRSRRGSRRESSSGRERSPRTG